MIESLAVTTWPDAVVPRPAAILEHPDKTRLYIYICAGCGEPFVLDTHLERGPALCGECRECQNA